MAKNNTTLNKLRTLVKQLIREEVQDKPIQKLKFNNKILNIFFINKPFNTLLYAETEEGEPYVDISTNIEGNSLLDAIWVEMGGIEEKIADKLSFLNKTSGKTKSGYNTYIMYEVI